MLRTSTKAPIPSRTAGSWACCPTTDELKRIQTVDVVIPVVNGPRLRLRCVMQPEEDLACVLERLGLRLPERVRVPESSTRM